MIMRRILLLVVFAGIIIRIYAQFYMPAFNVDEIALADNIKHKSFLELLFPLNNSQSAPPLFLWLQKIVITISPLPFWINIKILSTLCSIGALLLFHRLVKNSRGAFLMLSLFSLNPFIIYNSLTVKQYSFDLFFTVMLLLVFENKNFRKLSFLFFVVWIMFSNIGLFAAAGLVLFKMVMHIRESGKLSGLIRVFQQQLPIILAPLPYLFYFSWYMFQPGAEGVKEFMMEYWKENFIPFNTSIFNYTLALLQGFIVYFYNAWLWAGMALFIVTGLGIYHMIRNKVEILFKNEILVLMSILFVHLVLNGLHMYPFSDRLYLYLAPLFTLLAGVLINSDNSRFLKLRIYLSYSLVIVLIYGFLKYLPYKENSILAVYKYVENENIEKVYVSPRTAEEVLSFNDFTDNYFEKDILLLNADSNLYNSSILISRVHRKIRAEWKTAPEEKSTLLLLEKGKIALKKRVNGYNIYSVQ
jgi:hypothetical protein